MSVVEAELACHPPAARSEPLRFDAAAAQGPAVVAIVGRPNVGKSTFFGRASGRFVETANAPGTTVEAVRREVSLEGHSAVLVDLPGTLSLTGTSDLAIRIVLSDLDSGGPRGRCHRSPS